MPRARPTKPRKAPQQRRSQDMVAAILRATARVLVREGYEAATTNRIAQVAGISVGSLYQYFPNKEALVAELMAQHIRSMSALFQAKSAEFRESGVPLEAGVRLLIKAMLEAEAVEPRLHKVLLEQVPRVGGLDGLNAFTERLIEATKMVLDANKDRLIPQDTGIAAFVVVTAVQSAGQRARLTRPEYFESEAFAAELGELVGRYLFPRAP